METPGIASDSTVETTTAANSLLCITAPLRPPKGPPARIYHMGPGLGPLCTNATHCPWFLKPNDEYPPFLHWSFEVGSGGACTTTTSPSVTGVSPPAARNPQFVALLVLKEASKRSSPEPAGPPS